MCELWACARGGGTYEGVAVAFCFVQERDGVDGDAGAERVRLRDDEGGRRFLRTKFRGRRRVCGGDGGSHHELLRGVVELGAEVEDAPLELVVLLVVRVDLWVQRLRELERRRRLAELRVARPRLGGGRGGRGGRGRAAVRAFAGLGALRAAGPALRRRAVELDDARLAGGAGGRRGLRRLCRRRAGAVCGGRPFREEGRGASVPSGGHSPEAAD